MLWEREVRWVEVEMLVVQMRRRTRRARWPPSDAARRRRIVSESAPPSANAHNIVDVFFGHQWRFRWPNMI